MGERGLAAARGAGDQIEREFGQTAAQDFVQPRNAGGQSMDDDFVFHGVGSDAGGSLNGRSHRERNNRSVSEGPIKLLINS